MLTTLGRTSARVAISRMAATPAKQMGVSPFLLASRTLATTAVRHGGYDYNMGIPGSRIRNPDPEGYDDVYPGMGTKWWALIIISSSCWFWGNYYDTSRGVNISIGLFGPNLPL